jgi:DNA-binding CsgD family transcriptional regulator
LNRLGTLALHAGAYDRASAIFAEAERLIRAVGDQDGIAAVLGQLGYAALLQGDFQSAEARLGESLILYRGLGSKLGSGRVLIHLGRALNERGKPRAAAARLSEGISLTWEVGNRWYLAEGLEALAAARLADDHSESAACLWGAAEALRESIGAPVPPGDRQFYQTVICALRNRLGEEAFALAQSTGRGWTIEQSVADALKRDEHVEPNLPGESGQPTALGGLTAREIEVLRLVAEGKSNPEIADLLYISRRTASTHVTHILRKLDLSSRSAAAAFAFREGLVQTD